MVKKLLNMIAQGIYQFPIKGEGQKQKIINVTLKITHFCPNEYVSTIGLIQ